MGNKKVLLGVTGGIAAYKTPDLVRRLIERDAEVTVVMTDGAQQFVTPLTLQAVSGRAVRTSLWDAAAEAAMGHIELARWAEAILIAPATADCLARLAAGAASDLLTTLVLASEAPLTLAPAMNRLMWEHPATVRNRALLAERGVAFIGPASGDQACGESGPGRMVEPLDIASQFLAGGDGALAGRNVLITAGPTREPLDPVRFLSNRSSGRMGYALARAAREAGANVRLVSGPVALDAPYGVSVEKVETALEMFDCVAASLDGVDIFIGAAAIADYRPADFSATKLKKNDAAISVPMVRAPDTLASVAARAAPPFVVGFAAETNDVEKYARGKLNNKKLDMIVANQVGPGLGFDAPDNTASVFWADGGQAFPCQDKLTLARKLIALIAERYRRSERLLTMVRETVA